MRVLVTGCAGFIGMHLSRRLLDDGVNVVGVDNINDYYDPNLKLARLERLSISKAFEFHRFDLADRGAVDKLFSTGNFDRVIHLAAQAGVRYSLTHPHAYINSNIVAFANLLEACRTHPPGHLIYASSSSVYGGNRKLPFSVSDRTDNPISLYAATKKANELMAHTYSHLYGIPSTGLRFFTVYGPWGRPDMSAFLFTRAILAGEPIKVFNHGNMERDFTYVDDIVEGVVRVMNAIPPTQGAAPYRLYNIGNHRPEPLLRFIEILEQVLGKPARKEFLPMQPGDVPSTYADVEDLRQAVGFAPDTSLETGLHRFAQWYRDYYKIQDRSKHG
ncbi:MAG: NAD-dependent epimerase [Betaproteobacteria bacterium]|nr:NAD-dependent epimerase [Betaproteobacteria bacterium]